VRKEQNDDSNRNQIYSMIDLFLLMKVGERDLFGWTNVFNKIFPQIFVKEDVMFKLKMNSHPQISMGLVISSWLIVPDLYLLQIVTIRTTNIL